ncbi:thioredoxin family protein [Candidatus Kuenenbacteria bacterium]|nr:thioredoxin family protein [Candidatus Kuenenbacteria bacterium]
MFLFSGTIKAQEQEKVNIYFFWQQGCPHCAKEKPFLENLVKQNSFLELHSFDIGSSQDNINLLVEIGEKLNINIQGVPFTLISENYFIGWYDEQTTGAAVQQAVNLALVSSCRDVVKEIQNNKNIATAGSLTENACEQQENKVFLPSKISLPIFGEVELKNISLLALTIVLGFLDGFNPCAMWTLLFLISLLLGMQNRKRMWILGIVFIITSALVYFLFMSAWLNLILFLGFVFWVRIIIGILALLGGGYNLKEFLFNKNSGCKVTGDEKRQRMFQKIKIIIGQRSFWLAIGGIIILALLVNLVELICSAGLPAVYTQVLALTALSKVQYYFYIALYIFVFMLDDLFVFFVAMITLQMTGITTKYTRLSKLIGALLMIFIGLLLVFKPEWLMFG